MDSGQVQGAPEQYEEGAEIQLPATYDAGSGPIDECEFPEIVVAPGETHEWPVYLGRPCRVLAIRVGYTGLTLESVKVGTKVFSPAQVAMGDLAKEHIVKKPLTLVVHNPGEEHAALIGRYIIADAPIRGASAVQRPPPMPAVPAETPFVPVRPVPVKGGARAPVGRNLPTALTHQIARVAREAPPVAAVRPSTRRNTTPGAQSHALVSQSQGGNSRAEQARQEVLRAQQELQAAEHEETQAAYGDAERTGFATVSLPRAHMQLLLDFASGRRVPHFLVTPLRTALQQAMLESER